MGELNKNTEWESTKGLREPIKELEVSFFFSVLVIYKFILTFTFLLLLSSLLLGYAALLFCREITHGTTLLVK